MSKKSIEHQPSRTATGMAFYRAFANKEFNNKFGSDYLAEYFIPSFFGILLKVKNIRTRMKKRALIGMYEFSIARTQYFDDIFLNALKKDIPQIVILGAGYDTRAYRFAKQNNNTNIIKLDAPTTQNRKIERLKKAKIKVPDNIELVPINFHKESIEDVLRKTKYNKNKKTLFLWEGVSYYLEPESVNATLEFVKNTAHNESLIAFDYSISIPQEEMSNYYGVKVLIDYMAKKVPNEKCKFKLEEGTIELFLKKEDLK